jgi:hypothetical protein
MKNVNSALQRLLRSAALVPDREDFSVPFGFETRVVALWRAKAKANGNGVGQLIRRVAMLAAVVIVLSSAAAFHEFRQDRDIVELGSNEFAIADSAIENELAQ